MQLFYTPNIEGKEYTLPEEESKHAVRVLRLKNGDTLQLIDGSGGFYKAEIIDANPKRCTINILDCQKEFAKRSNYLHMAVAPTKNMDRLEWFLEKATEIGIDEITPILCDHSERKVIKAERLEKIIVSAMKQSLKAYKPKLNPLTPIADFMHAEFNGDKFIAHCYKEERWPLKDALKQQVNLILIGPEGDFSPAEVEKALECGFKPISLGEARLRTETAAIAACHTASLMLD